MTPAQAQQCKEEYQRIERGLFGDNIEFPLNGSIDDKTNARLEIGHRKILMTAIIGAGNDFDIIAALEIEIGQPWEDIERIVKGESCEN